MPSPAEDESLLLLNKVGPQFNRSTGNFIAVTCALIYFLRTFSEYVILAPNLRLLELALCREHYQTHDPSKIQRDGFVREEFCKAPSIQASLASYRSWQLCLNAVPALILCLPLGSLSDKHGRKPYLALSLCSWLLYQIWTHSVYWFYDLFHPSAILFSSLLGGAAPMFDAMISSIIADVSNPDEISPRLNYILASFLCAEMLAPTLSTCLADLSLWAPFLTGIVTAGLGFLLAILIPETLPRHGLGEAATQSSLNSPTLRNPASLPKAGLTSLIIPLFIFLVSPLRDIIIEIMIQYVSNRFSTSIKSAAYFVSIEGVFLVTFYLGLLPVLRKTMRSMFRLTPLKTDYILCTLYCLASLLGSILMGLAPTIKLFVPAFLFYTLGTGIRATWLAVIIAHVDESRTATLCSIISILETLGVIGGAPILETAAAKGFRLHDTAMGLPFYVASVMYFAGLVVIGAFKTRYIDE